MNPPRTFFSTALSGSAKETERRIRNIFQGQKKRPPIWLMALVVLSILLCGSLVSCQEREPSLSHSEMPSASSSGTSDRSATPMAAPSEYPWQEALAPYWNGSYYTRAYNDLDWLAGERGEMERTAQELLSGLTLQDFPTQTVDLSAPEPSLGWKERLWLLCQSPEADVSLYGVAVWEDPDLPKTGQALSTYGLILRHGDRWTYCPETWSPHYGTAPTLTLQDLDRDGQREAVVISDQGVGVGAWRQGLVIFELDDLSYARPDLSQFDAAISVQADSSAVELTLEDMTFSIPMSDVELAGTGWGGPDGATAVWLGVQFQYYTADGLGVTACFSLSTGFGPFTQGWLMADLTFDGGAYRFHNLRFCDADSPEYVR